MVSDTSAYVGDALLNWIKSSAFPSDPANVYASLWNGDPDSGGTEVTQSINLTRQAITFGSVSARAITTTGDISFGTANNTGTVTYVAIFDSSTAGNQICKKSVGSTSITNGLAVKILTGNLTLSY